MYLITSPYSVTTQKAKVDLITLQLTNNIMLVIACTLAIAMVLLIILRKLGSFPSSYLKIIALESTIGSETSESET